MRTGLRLDGERYRLQRASRGHLGIALVLYSAMGRHASGGWAPATTHAEVNSLVRMRRAWIKCKDHRSEVDGDSLRLIEKIHSKISVEPFGFRFLLGCEDVGGLKRDRPAAE